MSTQLAKDTDGAAIQAALPETTQVVAYTTAARSTQITGVTLVRIVATTACHYKVGGSSVTATVNDVYLPAGTIEYVRVESGKDYISFIQSSSGGNAYVTNCT